MGTNYYAELGTRCDHCGRDPEERYHVGKTSVGWVFSLHVVESYEWPPDHDDFQGLARPVDWSTWMDLLSRPDVTIRDEYGDAVSLDRMEAVVTRRRRWDEGRDDDPRSMGAGHWWDPAVGLWRARVDDGRSRPVPGETYDLVHGCFS
jgi:hypothetical protein